MCLCLRHLFWTARKKVEEPEPNHFNIPLEPECTEGDFEWDFEYHEYALDPIRHIFPYGAAQPISSAHSIENDQRKRLTSHRGRLRSRRQSAKELKDRSEEMRQEYEKMIKIREEMDKQLLQQSPKPPEYAEVVSMGVHTTTSTNSSSHTLSMTT